MDKLIKYVQYCNKLKPIELFDKLSIFGDIYINGSDVITISLQQIYNLHTPYMIPNGTHVITIYDMKLPNDIIYEKRQSYGGNISANTNAIKILTVYKTLLVFLAFYSEEIDYGGYAAAFPTEYTTVYFYNFSTQSVEYSFNISKYNITKCNYVRQNDIIYIHQNVYGMNEEYDGCFYMLNLKTKKCNSIVGKYNYPISNLCLERNTLILNIPNQMQKMQILVNINTPIISKYGLVTYKTSINKDIYVSIFNSRYEIINNDSYYLIIDRKIKQYIACFTLDQMHEKIIDIFKISTYKLAIKLMIKCSSFPIYMYIDLSHQNEIHQMYNAFTLSNQIKDELMYRLLP